MFIFHEVAVFIGSKRTINFPRLTNRGDWWLKARSTTIYEAYDHFTYCMLVFLLLQLPLSRAKFNPPKEKFMYKKTAGYFHFNICKM